ncbi:hypothetical protein SISSUDRAFT_1123321 [Sistotremastrum suecicum HHB10207 ss-3]|uniref:Uncharacterized protein n=1 Tax=Sistotremastrum suecicum HHB10207 ss-3 TaxID=1314776 RepID=A0A165XWN7_9AGAM|nr:hypothetical protein SISSUDRAFT_1123321 [Sistotremastrum suecicum HHB10207 ss-3]
MFLLLSSSFLLQQWTDALHNVGRRSLDEHYQARSSPRYQAMLLIDPDSRHSIRTTGVADDAECEELIEDLHASSRDFHWRGTDGESVARGSLGFSISSAMRMATTFALLTFLPIGYALGRVFWLWQIEGILEMIFGRQAISTDLWVGEIGCPYPTFRTLAQIVQRLGFHLGCSDDVAHSIRFLDLDPLSYDIWLVIDFIHPSLQRMTTASEYFGLSLGAESSEGLVIQLLIAVSVNRQSYSNASPDR